MKEFNEEYLHHLRTIINDHNDEEARRQLSDLHPADIAELYRDLDLTEAEYLFRLLDEEAQADVLMELDEDERSLLLSKMDAEDIAKQLEHLDTDDAVDIIQELDAEDRDKILSHIDDVEQAGDIIDLLQYDEDTAGGLMGTEMIVVNENWSMPECIKQMRMQAEDMDEVYYVYVVDNDDRLRGTLPLKKLITHPSVSKIKHVMEDNPVAVKADTPIDEVALDFEKYDLVAMPVIDSIGRLLGRITVDDVMDKVRDSSERDYQLASGLSTDVESDDKLFDQTKARLPWLLIGMIGGLCNSFILGKFEGGFVVDPALALFIPLIGDRGTRSCQRHPRRAQDRPPATARARRRPRQRRHHRTTRFHLQLSHHRHRPRSHHLRSEHLAILRSDVCLGLRHLRTPDARETQNRPGSGHRTLYLNHKRHHRHGHLYEHILLAHHGLPLTTLAIRPSKKSQDHHKLANSRPEQLPTKEFYRFFKKTPQKILSVQKIPLPLQRK